MDLQHRIRQLIEAQLGNLIVELAQANATIEALRAELASLKAEAETPTEP